jgi:hypothetical protein
MKHGRAQGTGLGEQDWELLIEIGVVSKLLKVESPPKTCFRLFVDYYYSFNELYFNILFASICVLHLCPVLHADLALAGGCG